MTRALRMTLPKPKKSAMIREDAIKGTVLEKLVAGSLARAAKLPPVTRRSVEEACRAPRAAKSFEAALRAPGRRFILEVKSASPSLGVIREHTDLHEYARAYGRFADAVSVLTEPSRFGGSLLRLRAMRAETDLPIIAKDFMTDRRQLVAARAAGADAVLLMLSVLTMKGYEELAAMAGALGLDVLTEVSNEAELAEALSLNARIIGINNRDLRNLSIDLSRTEKLAPLVPEGRLIVSESGIKDHATIERLAPYAKAFLIGSAIGLSQDISCGVRRVLFGESKCCGITRAEDALAAARAGALRVGIVTAKRSPRCVSPAQFKKLAAEIRRETAAAGLPVKITAVADAADRRTLADLEGLDFDELQLHGETDEAFLRSLRIQFKGKTLIGVYAMNDLTEAEKKARAAQIDGLLEKKLIDRALLDAANKNGQTGGTGKTVDFDVIRLFRHPEAVLLAGGLNPANARAAAASLAAGLDFNSGLETAPGIKSAALIARAFGALRGSL
jgi:indole-3-glycerol phosphate synthase/phosphoribosylanthranilate isomerase